MIIFMCIAFSNITALAQTGYWQEGFFGHTVTVNVIKLSNGTEAWQYVAGDYTDKEKAQIKDYVMSSYQIFMQLYAGDATVKYNCHSYAWYSQAIQNDYWISDPYNFRLGRWIKSTGWTNTIPSGINSGDIVDYYRSESDRPHSAVVYSPMLNLFASKWGSAGLYVHSPTEVPADYYSKDLGYYR